MMFVTKRSLDRRTVLRGMGTVLALPFLESMVPAVTALAQSPAKPQSNQPAAPAATTGTPPAAPTPEPAPYSYDPQGRRDPFVNLLARGSDTRGAATRAAGLPGVLIAEASVKGIVRGLGKLCNVGRCFYGGRRSLGGFGGHADS